ncbi:protein S40-1-like [Bidens hawaiensis]|uniref:protein S40-1-like n=1 Tax=Bidens hawaiensis TaxID=980011 RepID=UPI004049E3DB
MTEEFQDSDILFPETAYRHPIVEKKNNKKTHNKKSSFEENDAREEEMVPPHMILDRRSAGKAAFSLCSGNGRTLKGRDLSEVRNSVLRMTGFIES